MWFFVIKKNEMKKQIIRSKFNKQTIRKQIREKK